MLLVIEGDNASGKTTIGKLLEQEGFHNISEEDSIKEIELSCKQLPRDSFMRIEAFFSYNEHCAQKSIHYVNSVILRYWMSTLCAGYADQMITWNEVGKMVQKCLKKYRRPDAVIYLDCSYQTRIARINKRQSQDDDVSVARHNRYQKVISFLRTIVPLWYDISVENKMPIQVVRDIVQIIQIRGKDSSFYDPEIQK